MLQSQFRHTIKIFERMYNDLPPLVPAEISQQLKEKLDLAMADGKLTLEELEDIMISLGKQLWPYVQAFEEIYKLHEDRLAEKLFLQKASRNLQKKYSTFRDMGGGFRDIYYGGVDVFVPEERSELGALLVELKNDIRRYAMQAVMSHDRSTYEQKVEKYGGMITEINDILVELNLLAQEDEYIDLAEDIRSQIRGVEYGLAWLGPVLDMEEVRSLKENFLARKERQKVY